MDLKQNDRIQELFLVLGDKLAIINKKWWYALVIGVIAVIPVFYLLKVTFIQILTSSYEPPKIVYSAALKEPLELTDKQILTLPNNSYSGYFKIKNINLEWGVPQQQYTAIFQTFGGTVLNQTTATTFVLPSSEKLIVIPRFSSDRAPDELIVRLVHNQFVKKPNIDIDLELERVNLQTNSEGLMISAGVKNKTPFTIKEINLPVIIYNAQNQVVGVNFTTINDVTSGETRTFQYVPVKISGAVRAEINPEINIFDRNVLETQGGVSPFDRQ